MKRKTNKKSYYKSKGTGSKVIHTGYGSIAKKRVSRGTPKTDLEKETMKLIRKANARLDSLQRRYKSGTWASKNLNTRLTTKQLNMMTKNGKIKVNKKMTNTQMVAVNKAINQFLRSKTSTNQGIQDVRKQQIEKIKLRYSIDDEEFTNEDAEDFYEMYGNNDFEYFAEKIGSSKLQQIVYDGIKDDDSEDDFLLRLDDYVKLNDLDIREKAIRLYNKYVA